MAEIRDFIQWQVFPAYPDRPAGLQWASRLTWTANGRDMGLVVESPHDLDITDAYNLAVQASIDRGRA